MTAAPELSVLIVNYNSWRVCALALESLLRHPPRRADGTVMPHEVVVVDNASPQDDPEHRERATRFVTRIGGTLVLHGENGGYSTGMNLAHRHARGTRWTLISNPDVVFLEGCVDRLLRYMEAREDCGAAAPEGFWDRGLDCRLPPNILPTLADLWGVTRAGLGAAGVRRYSQRRTREAVRVWTASEPIELDMLSGCCFLMRTAFFEEVGRFDERFPLYYEDTDLSVRIRRAGKRIVQVAGARLVHLYNRSGQTNADEAMARYWTSRALYYRKWYGRLGDWLQRLSRGVLESAWGQRRAARAPQPGLRRVAPSTGKPTLELPRPAARFVVEISLDQRFYLAAGCFGSGDRWTPSDELFDNFGVTTFYFRVCDIAGGEPEELGVYEFERLPPPPDGAARGSGASPQPQETGPR